MRLTEEQRALVERNHNLIYYVLNGNGWSIEDYYDIAAIGLCRAAITYDESRGNAFSTYACIAIKNKVFKVMRDSRAKCRSGYLLVSLEEPLFDSDGKLTVGDTLKDLDGPEPHADASEILGHIEKLRPNERQVLELTIAGYLQREIGEIIGESQVNVSRHLRRARQKLLRAV